MTQLLPRPAVDAADLAARAMTDASAELAHIAAAVDDHPAGRAALAAAVESIEAAAGAGLGPTTGDPVVALHRRLGRGLRRLRGPGGPRVAAVDLLVHVEALRAAATAEQIGD